jgi:hypothetical protein
MVDGLSAPDKWADKFINDKKFVLGDVGAGPRFNKNFAVCIMGLFVEVVFFAQHALKLVETTIANVRRLVELVTYLFLIIRADFVTQFAA